jgi:hypothetical protein
LRNASTDDTYIPDENEAHRQANSGQYIGVSGINALTRRLRHSLTYVYEEGMSDDDLVSALEGLDRNIQRFAGFVTSQTGNEAAVPPGIRELNEWIQNRQNSSNSIYSCR